MSDTGDYLLEVRDHEVHFPIRRGVVFDRTVGHVRAVDGVSLKVRRGSTYGLVGESGCGKSTFGRAVLRLEEPTGGTVTLDGTDVTTLKGEKLRQARRRMQMVFQDPLASLDPRQSVQSLMIEPLRVPDPRPPAELVARAAARPGPAGGDSATHRRGAEVRRLAGEALSPCRQRRLQVRQ